MSSSNFVSESSPPENHLTWFEEHLRLLVNNQNQKGHVKHDTYILHLLNNLPRNLFNEESRGILSIDTEDATEDEGGEGGLSPSFLSMAIGMNEVAMNLYVKNMESAKAHLRTVEGLLKHANLIQKFTVGHLLAASYAAQSLQHAVNIQESSQAGKSSSEEYQLKSAELQKRWEYTQNDREGFAVLQFFKGALGIALRVPSEHIIEFFNNAIYRNPLFYAWRHYMFRFLRMLRQRRSQPFIPFSREFMECEMAYNLAPDNFCCRISLVTMTMESLWHLSEGHWETRRTDCEYCEKTLREAMENARKKNMRVQLYTSKLYLGKLLVFGKLPGMDQAYGKSLLEECKEERPDNFLALYSLAQLHHWGASRTEEFKDLTKAADYYKQALDTNGSNSGCIVEYLEVLKKKAALLHFNSHRREYYKKMADVLETSWKRMDNGFHQAYLWSMKACIIWICDPLREENHRDLATREWIKVLTTFPEFAGNLVEMLRSPPLFHRPNEDPCIVLDDVVRYLEKIQREGEELKDDQDHDQIADFINKLKSYSCVCRFVGQTVISK